MVDLNGTLLIQIVNFLVLVLILGHFAYKPMLKVLDDRKLRIKNDLDSAANAKTDAEKLKLEYESQLKEAQVKAQEVISKAVKEAQSQAQAQIDAAHAAIEKEKDAASRQIAQERQEALEELKDQVATLSCEIASKLISKTMTPETNDKIIADSIAKLAASKAGK